MSTHTSLGRGLSALLSVDTIVPKTEAQGEVRYININDVSPGPYQPRQIFDPEHLDDLAKSIEKQGILQPLIVRPLQNQVTNYEIVAGERRWQAAKKAGLSQVPVLVKDLSDRQTLEVAITENVQRADLNPIEEAEGYKRLMDDFSYTQEEVSQNVGKSRSHVANTVRLLALPEKIRHYLESGQLTAGHARALLTSGDPEALAEKIIHQKLNVRQTEQAAKSRKKGQQVPVSQDTDIASLEEVLTQYLGLQARIEQKGQGGEIRIGFKSMDQLDRLTTHLSGLPMGQF